jgi:hypothetical protein
MGFTNVVVGPGAVTVVVVAGTVVPGLVVVTGAPVVVVVPPGAGAVVVVVVVGGAWASAGVGEARATETMAAARQAAASRPAGGRKGLVIVAVAVARAYTAVSAQGGGRRSFSSRSPSGAAVGRPTRDRSVVESWPPEGT